MEKLFLQQQFMSRLTSYIPSLTQRSDSLWVMRCPYCGDSKKDANKKRGYMFEDVKAKSLRYFCHNCPEGGSFEKFLKYISPTLFEEYLLDSFGTRREKISLNRPIKSDFGLKKRVTLSLPKISELSKKHPAYLYCVNRKLPEKAFDILYYTDHFKDTILSLNEDDEHNFPNDERIIIPFKDEENRLLGVSGRAIRADTDLRYCTAKITKDSIKVFGLENIDFKQPIYVVEGPLDSFFLPNCVATMDSNLLSVLKHIGLDNDYVFIFDNQPRNKEIVAQVRRAVKSEHKVFIPPSRLEESGKDINELVLSGMKPDEILYTINKHTFQGLEAELEFNKWKKI